MAGTSLSILETETAEAYDLLFGAMLTKDMRHFTDAHIQYHILYDVFIMRRKMDLGEATFPVKAQENVHALLQIIVGTAILDGYILLQSGRPAGREDLGVLGEHAFTPLHRTSSAAIYDKDALERFGFQLGYQDAICAIHSLFCALGAVAGEKPAMKGGPPLGNHQLYK